MSATSDKSMRVRNIVVGIVVVAVLAALVWFWRQGREAPQGTSQPSPIAEQEATDAEMPDDGAAPATSAPAASLDTLRLWTELAGEPPQWPADFSEPESCEGVRNELARICAALDVRAPALREHGGACTLIEQLGSELAAAPPDLSSELRSYDTLLRNVFHLFRVAGRERMQAIRRALAEQDLAEPAALALYRWAISHERCARSDAQPVSGEALYAYAGFIFNTLGGQAYLRRRSPRVEALACFYGLQALDGAIHAGHNPDGLDPRPEIPRCRDLVAQQGFVFADRYVAELEEMSRRWKARDFAGP
jgi:hypothetical protein